MCFTYIKIRCFFVARSYTITLALSLHHSSVQCYTIYVYSKNSSAETAARRNFHPHWNRLTRKQEDTNERADTGFHRFSVSWRFCLFFRKFFDKEARQGSKAIEGIWDDALSKTEPEG
jgi:hypothetical protein